MRQFLQFLLFLLIGSKNEPVNSLHKKQEPFSFKDLNWTFIVLALAMVLFFVIIFVFQVGNSYPNDLMTGNVNV